LDAVCAKLPTSASEEDKARRMQLWARMDVNGNGYLSLAEVDKAVRDVLAVPELFSAKPVLMRAFQASKQARQTHSKHGSDYVERSELHALLVCLRRYYELYAMFNSVDASDDRRIDMQEFEASLPLLQEWGISCPKPSEEFAAIDSNGGNLILFDEFCSWALQKGLALQPSDEKTLDQKLSEEEVTLEGYVAGEEPVAADETETASVAFAQNLAGAEVSELDAVCAKLPTSASEEDKARRMQLWARMDVNGNGYLSLAEVDKAVRDVLAVPELFSAKPVLMRAFQASKQARQTHSKHGSDYVERSELHALLVCLRRYYELYAMFNSVDASDDRRIDMQEFEASLPLLQEWGISCPKPSEEFAAIDSNGGNLILFDEFCSWALQKGLALQPSDEKTLDQKLSEEEVEPADESNMPVRESEAVSEFTVDLSDGEALFKLLSQTSANAVPPASVSRDDYFSEANGWDLNGLADDLRLSGVEQTAPAFR